MSGRCPKSRWTARGRTWGSPFYMVVYIYSSSWHKQICYAPFIYFVKHCITLILDETPMGSELVLAPLVVLLGIHELGRNLPLVASRVWSVCVHRRLCLTSLLPTVSRHIDMLVLVKIVMIILVQMGLRHSAL